MQNFTILTVILKDSERTHRHKFPLYDDYTVNPNDPVIQACIAEAQKSFGDAEDIKIKIDMECV